MYFAKMFILLSIMSMLGYYITWISKNGLKYKKYLAKKGIKTQAKVIGIIKNIDYDSYTYFLEYDAKGIKKNEEYHLKQIWNIPQNEKFKKAHPLRSQLTIKYDRKKPEKFIVNGDENNKKEFIECQILGYAIMIVSISLLILNIFK